MHRLLTLSASCIFIVACSTTRIHQPAFSERQDLVELARMQIGDKYRYGGNGPNHFDCSGLVEYVYNAQEIPLQGSASMLSRVGPNIHRERAQPGDLIFYKKNGRVFHVSIISEVHKSHLWVVHSTSSRGVIEEEILSSSYWKPVIHKIISLDALIK